MLPKSNQSPSRAVDALADQVGVAGVAGGLFDHVEEDPAHAEGHAATVRELGHGVEVADVGDGRPTAGARLVVEARSTPRARRRRRCGSPSWDRPSDRLRPTARRARCPRTRRANQMSSAQARCLISPPIVSSDGPRRTANCSARQALRLAHHHGPVVVEDTPSAGRTRRQSACAPGRWRASSSSVTPIERSRATRRAAPASPPPPECAGRRDRGRRGRDRRRLRHTPRPPCTTARRPGSPTRRGRCRPRSSHPSKRPAATHPRSRAAAPRARNCHQPHDLPRRQPADTDHRRPDVLATRRRQAVLADPGTGAAHRLHPLPRRLVGDEGDRRAVVVDDAQRRGEPRDATAGVRRAVERVDDHDAVTVA